MRVTCPQDLRTTIGSFALNASPSAKDLAAKRTPLPLSRAQVWEFHLHVEVIDIVRKRKASRESTLSLRIEFIVQRSNVPVSVLYWYL